jgi:hypothetical protein
LKVAFQVRSMLNLVEPPFNTAEEKASEVYWLPWSVFAISGVPQLWQAL